ncbi:recombinase family protein [Zavarzinia sp. CC-PAN008]|uniref:recombinase family protein n=1 Tax=Zavarzinia sp. CC-PAN008 TaxID=3243332 RepID=UPI003F749BD9
MAEGRFVAYYRVSTDRQGKSGLGLEAQRAAVLGYLNGGAWDLVAEFTEVETGKRSDRPELLKALAACRIRNATLVIAKLDRLARNVAFIANLMEAGVPFIAIDNPHATPFTIHILAAVAEHEAKAISERTRNALKAAKARGTKLGGSRHDLSRFATKAAGASAKVRSSTAAKYARDLAPVIEEIRAAGITTLRGVADELNARGIPAARGGTWSSVQVSRVLAR